MSSWNKKGASMYAQGKSAAIVRVVVSLLLVVLLVGNIGYTVYHSIVGRMNIISSNTVDTNYTDVESLGSEDGLSEIDSVPDEIVQSTEEIEIVLLLGCDMDEGRANERSDTMMLGVIDRTHQKIKLISLLRDCYVSIPGYKNNKLNAAFAYDSAKGHEQPVLLQSTIAKNFGIQTEKFVKISFDAFESLVDAMGGVTVEVTAHEADYMCNDYKYGLFPRYSAGAGVYTMDGAEALNYVRMRRGQSDFQRTERQRKMLSLLMKQATDLSYLEIAEVVKQILPHITTNYSEAELLGLAFEAVSILKYEIVQYTVPINGSWSYGEVLIGGARTSVLAVNYSFNSAQLQRFIFEDDMTYANGAEASGVLPARLTLPSETETTETGTETTTQTTGETSTATAAEQTTTTGSETTQTTTSATASTQTIPDEPNPQ